jgi:DNA-binding response OmpR family regulator
MKILVVEDEIKLADYLNKGLAEEGFTVDVAHNGIDGCTWPVKWTMT